MESDDTIAKRIRTLSKMRNALGRMSAQPPGQTAVDLPQSKVANEAMFRDEQKSRQGPISRGVNAITEFASTEPPGGPRQGFIPEVTLMPKALETAISSALLVAAPTQSATQIARGIVSKSPKWAKMLPAVTEVVSSYITRKQNVLQELEEPGAVGDVLSVAAPVVSRGIPAAIKTTKKLFAPQLSRSDAAALAVVPPSGVSTRELLERAGELKGHDGDVVSRALRGDRIRDTIKQASTDVKAHVDEAYSAVRQQVSDHLGGNPLIDVTDVAKRAESLGLPFDRLGVEVTTNEAGRKMATFDDILRLKSRMGGNASKAFPTDRIKADGLRRVWSEADAIVTREADKAGAGLALKQANSLFRHDMMRFRTKQAEKLLDSVRTSGEDIINMGPGLKKNQAVAMQSLVVRTADELKENGRALFSQADALHEWHTGVSAKLIKDSVSNATGQIRPNQLLGAIDAMSEDARKIVLGVDGARALRDFALKLSQAQKRVTFGVGTASLVGLASTGAKAAGAVGGVAALETINELTMLGRFLVGNPVVARKLLNRVLRGEPDAITKFSALTGIRIALMEALTDAPAIAEDVSNFTASPPQFPDTAGAPR